MAAPMPVPPTVTSARFPANRIVRAYRSNEDETVRPMSGACARHGIESCRTRLRVGGVARHTEPIEAGLTTDDSVASHPRRHEMSDVDRSKPDTPKFIMVTGGTSGIGRATAGRLADAGHVVFAAARRGSALESLARNHPNVRPVVLD